MFASHRPDVWPANLKNCAHLGDRRSAAEEDFWSEPDFLSGGAKRSHMIGVEVERQRSFLTGRAADADTDLFGGTADLSRIGDLNDRALTNTLKEVKESEGGSLGTGYDTKQLAWTRLTNAQRLRGRMLFRWLCTSCEHVWEEASARAVSPRGR